MMLPLLCGGRLDSTFDSCSKDMGSNPTEAEEIDENKNLMYMAHFCGIAFVM